MMCPWETAWVEPPRRFFARKDSNVLTFPNRTKLFITAALMLGAAGLSACDSGTSAGTTPTIIQGGAPSPQSTGAATIVVPDAVATGSGSDIASPVTTAQPALTPTSSK